MDRDDRIEARRQRREAAMRSFEEESISTEAEDTSGQELRTRAMQEAAGVIERKLAETSEAITCLKVDFDDQENQRRIVEENDRLDRFESLQLETILSGRKNTIIEMNWADLLEMDFPLDLQNSLVEQRKECVLITGEKDRRIREYQGELKNKDGLFVRTMQVMARDTHRMVDLMREQSRVMTLTYEEQWAKVEQTFAKARTDMRKKNKNEMENLFELKLHLEETVFRENREARESAFCSRSAEMWEKETDDFTVSKGVLERSVQELERQYEKMMGQFHINKEKLDYNLQVLSERSREHMAIQSTYKNRLNRLRQTLHQLKTRYHTSDRKYKTENAELAAEYKRMTTKYNDLVAKYKRCEEAEENTFREVWEMNEVEVRALITKILDADRIIHKQQLGLPWSPPKEETTTTETETLLSDMENSKAAGDPLDIDEMMWKYPPAKVKKAFDLIMEEAQFLLDAGVREQMREYPERKNALIVDAIMRYVGVENQEEADMLIGFFYQGQDVDDETLYTDHDDVLPILKTFITEKENLRSQDVVPDKKKKRKKKVLAVESEAEQKQRRSNEERKFWERLSRTFPPMSIRIWNVLYTSLKRYYALLKKRSDDIKTAVRLEKENAEIKKLLAQYLGAGINDELQVPPSHVIQITKREAHAA